MWFDNANTDCIYSQNTQLAFGYLNNSYALLSSEGHIKYLLSYKSEMGP